MRHASRMLEKQLRRFEPFREMSSSELNTVARHAQVLQMPAQRWLVRPGRQLNGSYFLLRGKLSCYSLDRRVHCGARAAERAVYPGALGIKTRTAAQLLWVDTAPLSFLLGVHKEPIGLDIRLEAWERRFLAAPGLKNMQPASWQRFFAQFEEQLVWEGADVVRYGDEAAHFFVLKSGFANVHRSGRRLAGLAAGDFFGEDALVLGARRNATITMEQDGVVLRLPKDAFLDALGGEIVRVVVTPGKGRLLNVANYAETGVGAEQCALALGRLRESIPGLDRGATYYVTGGRVVERVLASFILEQRGIEAYCVDASSGDGTPVGPGA
ncbi:MAG: cyclic nucleotide-binding domain-containing protein [Pseudomonadales bacterium]|nr:cyclic nucleotide-binding domain-containing protein [Pseudomonadales bacterium]MDP6970426.1 cyclic nucleotide-binding domain-containing protein [Pseudomonadales bacterium]